MTQIMIDVKTTETKQSQKKRENGGGRRSTEVRERVIRP